MRGKRRFAVFNSGAEYHATKEMPFARYFGTRGEEKGVSLNSLCGAHIGLVPYVEAVCADGKPKPRLYEEPPGGYVLCPQCAQMGRGRTQEFVLSWSPGAAGPYREVVRQQYNFSPPGVTTEVEDYVVELDGEAALELVIVPDISGGQACASLAQLRLA